MGSLDDGQLASAVGTQDNSDTIDGDYRFSRHARPAAAAGEVNEPLWAPPVGLRIILQLIEPLA